MPPDCRDRRDPRMNSRPSKPLQTSIEKSALRPPWRVNFQGFPRKGPQGTPRRPKGSQREPKGAPRCAQGGPKGAKETPRASQREPRGAQSQPKGVQGQPKGSPKSPKGSQGHPKDTLQAGVQRMPVLHPPSARPPIHLPIHLQPSATRPPRFRRTPYISKLPINRKADVML